MTDRYDENLILGYVEGNLMGAERSDFERALMADAKLRALVDDLKDQRRELRELPDVPAPPQIVETIRQRLERDMLLEPLPEPVTGPARRLMLTRWAVAGGIAAVVLISTSVVLSVLLRGPGGPPASVTNQTGLFAIKPAAGPTAAPAGSPTSAPAELTKEALSRIDENPSLTLAAPELSGGEGELLTYCTQNGIGVERRLDKAPALQNELRQDGAIAEKGLLPRMEFTLQVRREQVPVIAAHFRSLWGDGAVGTSTGTQVPGAGHTTDMADRSTGESAITSAATTQPTVLAVEADARARRGAERPLVTSNAVPIEMQQSAPEAAKPAAGPDAVREIAPKGDDHQIVSLHVILIESRLATQPAVK
jgi:hypothetical protein